MTTGFPPPYVLGREAREHHRLDLQGRIYGDITRRAFRRAGIEEGMRVLDVGSGSGDVSILAAELVGPTGSVMGVDRDPDAVAWARERAEHAGAANVTFEAAEMVDAPGEGYDALVGRFILMHQEDPAGALAGAARKVRQGGVVVMEESNLESLLAGDHSLPTSRLYGRILRWTCAVLRYAGVDLRAGLRLREVFVEAGLPAPDTHLEAPVEGGPDSRYYSYLAESMRSLLPVALEAGLDDFDADEIHRAEEALTDEVVASGGVLVGWPVVAAWSRKS